MALGDILGGALGGAGTGFGIGGPWGALGGGLLGGLAGAFSGKKNDPFTTPGKETRFEKYTPEQQALIQQLMGALTGSGAVPRSGLLGQLLGEEGFDAYKEPALRTYFEEIVPGIAERFTQAGAQRSSAFQNALARSGENLSRSLGEMRGQQQQNLLNSLLGQVLSPQFTTFYNPQGLSGLGSLLGGLGSSLGSSGGQALGQSLIDRINPAQKSSLAGASI